MACSKVAGLQFLCVHDYYVAAPEMRKSEAWVKMYDKKQKDPLLAVKIQVLFNRFKKETELYKSFKLLWTLPLPAVAADTKLANREHQIQQLRDHLLIKLRTCPKENTEEEGKAPSSASAA